MKKNKLDLIKNLVPKEMHKNLIDVYGSCWRVEGITPNITNNDAFKGYIPFKPTVGFRFICHTLSTNVVKEILEESEEGGKFLTYSSSIYKWKIIKKDEL